MLKIIPDITLHKGMPNNLVQSKYFGPKFSNFSHFFILFDDLMRTIMNDYTTANLFMEGVHNRSICVVFMIQNIFFQCKQSKSISVNAHYFILLKKPQSDYK